MSTHAHKALEHVNRNGHHTSSTIEPYSHVAIATLDKQTHTIPSRVSVGQGAYMSSQTRPSNPVLSTELVHILNTFCQMIFMLLRICI